MSKKNESRKESGNAVVIVLVVLVVVAVGALAFLSGKMISKEEAVSPGSPAPSQQQAQANQPPPQERIVVEPGNPVVAKIGKTEIMRVDVFNFIQQLPEKARQQPVQQLFPLAMEQVINARIIEAKTAKVNLDKDPEVKKQMEAAKKQIVRNVYIQNEVTKKLTDERLKQAYGQYTANFPDIEEVKARHILVESESKARGLISQLNEGASFEDLAKANSTDATAANGGELGYFAQGDVVPAFSDAAFKTEVGSYTKKPIKTEFGFHVIKVEEKRKRPPADFKTAKPFLETQLRRVALDEVIQGWRDEANIERFDINGKPIEPAAGGEAAQPAQ